MSHSQNAAQRQFSTRRNPHSVGQTILTFPFLGYYRSVPTEDQILVPETLLKKRKSQEKQREERAAEVEKRKKVSAAPLLHSRGGTLSWTW